jgi:hypothetical protein
MYAYDFEVKCVHGGGIPPRIKKDIVLSKPEKKYNRRRTRLDRAPKETLIFLDAMAQPCMESLDRASA